MYRGALRSIISELLRQERLLVISELSVSAPKTKELAGKLNDLGLQEVLIVVDQPDENLYLAARNLRNVGICDVNEVDPASLVGFDRVLVSSEAVKKLEARLS